MKIRHLLIPAAVALLFATSQIVAAQTTTSNKSDTRIIAAIVQVDNQGTITQVTPDVDLQPTLRKLLHQTLEQMITKPAHDSHGKAIASQMVMQLSMDANQQADGSYQAKFAYLKARSLPVAQNYAWRKLHNGQKPALIMVDALSNNSRVTAARSQMMIQQSIAKGEAARQSRQSNSNSGGSSHDH